MFNVPLEANYREESRLKRQRAAERKGESGEPNICPSFSDALLPLNEKCYNTVFKNPGSEVGEPGLKS